MDEMMKAAGLHDAVCFQVVDCGQQRWEFHGQSRMVREIRMSFELVNERSPDGRRRVLTRRWNRTWAASGRLRGDMLSWTGDVGILGWPVRYDFAPLVGRPARLTVDRNESGYRRITKIRPLQPAVKPEHETLHLDLLHFNVDAFHRLPPFLKDYVMQSRTFLIAHGQHVTPPEHHREPRDAGELIGDEVPW